MALTEEQGIALVQERKNRVGTVARLFSFLCDRCGKVAFCLHMEPRFCSNECRYETFKGAGHPSWRGGTHKSNGYVLLYKPKHPNANALGRVFEHRLVMERMIGRYLNKHDNVHHKNGVRSDNRPENLELWCKPQPAGQRVWDLIIWVVRNYKNEVKALLEAESYADSFTPPIRKNG